MIQNGARTDLEQKQNFIPYDDIDIDKYEIFHPDVAANLLGMVRRTIDKKINNGEILFTVEKGHRRVLLERSSIGSRSEVELHNSVLDHSKPSSESFHNESRPIPESNLSVLEFQPVIDLVRESMNRTDAYFNEIKELTKENAQYKLLTDGKNQENNNLKREIEELKTLLFEREAKIKEMSEKLESTIEINSDGDPHRPWWKRLLGG